MTDEAKDKIHNMVLHMEGDSDQVVNELLLLFGQKIITEEETKEAVDRQINFHFENCVLKTTTIASLLAYRVWTIDDARRHLKLDLDMVAA